MPILGLGTYGIRSAQPFYTALQVGYRHFDTATLYDNEQYIGAAIKRGFDENIVKRDDLFITTKLWHTDYNDPESALRLSL